MGRFVLSPWQYLPSVQCQYSVRRPNLQQPHSETKEILVLIIIQWRVTTNTLCWWVLERSLNSSCSEADPHLCIPSAGRATARKQDQKRASDINTTTSVCSVAQFLLVFFFCLIFDLCSRFSRLFSTSWKSKPLWKVELIIAQKPLEDLIVIRFLHYSCHPLSITSCNHPWALACFSLKFSFRFYNFRSIIPLSKSKLKVSHLALHPQSWVCSF